jgi:metal-responsive CopG/Arc/MetJ family transcriptional regulator
MGRPPKLGEKRAGIYPMRLPDEIINAVDAFAEREGMKTRSEAFRRLLEIGLAVSKPAPKLASRSRSAKGSKREGGSL